MMALPTESYASASTQRRDCWKRWYSSSIPARLSGSRGESLVEEGRDSLAVGVIDVAWSEQQLG